MPDPLIIVALGVAAFLVLAGLALLVSVVPPQSEPRTVSPNITPMSMWTSKTTYAPLGKNAPTEGAEQGQDSQTSVRG